MMWLPFDDMFSLFDTIPACDRHTDGRKDKQLATAQSALYIYHRAVIMQTCAKADTTIYKTTTLWCQKVYRLMFDNNFGKC